MPPAPGMMPQQPAMQPSNAYVQPETGMMSNGTSPANRKPNPIKRLFRIVWKTIVTIFCIGWLLRFFFGDLSVLLFSRSDEQIIADVKPLLQEMIDKSECWKPSISEIYEIEQNDNDRDRYIAKARLDGGSVLEFDIHYTPDKEEVRVKVLKKNLNDAAVVKISEYLVNGILTDYEIESTCTILVPINERDYIKGVRGDKK